MQVSTELTERAARSREMAREADLLKHGLAEIEAVAPQPGEDDELQAKASRLADADQLRESATGAAYAVSGSPEGDPDVPGALGLIADARHRLSGSEDPRLRELEPRLAEAEALLVDVGTELSGYLESLDADPAALEQVLARQSELKQLTRKYAADVDGVLAWAQDAAERLAGLDTSEEALAELARRATSWRSTLAELAAQGDRAAGGRGGQAGAGGHGRAGRPGDGPGGDRGDRQHPLGRAERRSTRCGSPAARAVRRSRTPGPDGVDEVEIRLRAHDGARAAAGAQGRVRR